MNVGNFTVQWTYDKDFIPQHAKGSTGKKVVTNKRRDLTICTIYDTTVAEGEDPVVSRESIARMWSDLDCRDTARKISMEKALAFSELEKEQRAMFWEVYRTQTKEPRWNNKSL